MPQSWSVKGWSIKGKLIAAQIAFVLGLMLALFFLYAWQSRSQTVEFYVEKARTVTLAVEAARMEMEAKWELGLFTAQDLLAYGREGQKDKLLAAVPVVTAWRTAQRNAQEGQYQFKIPKFQPRNPANEPDAQEAQVLKLFKESNLNEHYIIDSKTNAVRYFRAVRLSKACLYCHGQPSLSQEYWGNDKGLDPLGGPMEGWKVGEVHGAFEVIQSLDPADQRLTTNLLVAGGVALVMVFFGGLISFLIAQGISRPIRATAKVVSRAAEGDFTSQVETKLLERGDEVGQVLRNVDEMNQKLSETVRLVTEAAFAVANGAGEINQANQDLSERTQQQASAIEQTASAIEEMTGSVKQNAENSGQANQLARATAQMAQEGGEVVRRTVAAMEAVTDSSKKIADIINVVNEIAFQTNLLALNAAVEAARAGEAGRGFAVVAGEVRSLAGRSASAAKEIQTLISDSVSKVAQGNELVAESGRLLGKIIQNVQRVADTVGEISAASQEQATGISEVNKAVAQMDDAVQQNAALVEETTSASEGLAHSARELRSRMEGFRVRESGWSGQPSEPRALPQPEDDELD